MQVSTKLLNQQQVRQFSKINDKIADAQERVSTGKNILRASDDPVAAVNLSVAKEQSLLLGQFQRNIESADTKLNMTDLTLQETVNVLTRFSELITMARNGALNEEGHLAISTEMKQLKEVLLGLANTTDANGQGIFSGLMVLVDHLNFWLMVVLNILETGAKTASRYRKTCRFPQILTVGRHSCASILMAEEEALFDIVDLTINAVETASAYSPRANANYKAEVLFELPARLDEFSMELTGSVGTKTISAMVNEGGLQNMVDAINSSSSETGTTASLNADGKTITLLDDMNGDITIENIQIEGINSALEQVTSYIEFTGFDADGVATTKVQKMTDADQLVSSSIGNVQNAIDNLSLQRAFVGGQLSKAATQIDVVGARKLAVDRDVSRLGDADLAALITDLQAQLTNLNAAQAAFAKIGQQSLFDFIR